MKKHLILVLHPERMHPSLAQFATLQGDYTVLVTDPTLVEQAREHCDSATLYCLQDGRQCPSRVWDEAKAGLDSLKGLGQPDYYLFQPWIHDSDKAITGEALLIERLQDVLPGVVGGKAMLEEMFQKQMPIFAGARA